MDLLIYISSIVFISLVAIFTYKLYIHIRAMKDNRDEMEKLEKAIKDHKPEDDWFYRWKGDVKWKKLISIWNVPVENH